jgi:hypothetical protein
VTRDATAVLASAAAATERSAFLMGTAVLLWVVDALAHLHARILVDWSQ